jgi:hypothetical protein
MVGLYEVTAVLPEFQNRQRYRVRYYGSFIEQVIEETDLSPAKAMTHDTSRGSPRAPGTSTRLRQRRYMQGQLAIIALLSAALVALLLRSLF